MSTASLSTMVRDSAPLDFVQLGPKLISRSHSGDTGAPDWLDIGSRRSLESADVRDIGNVSPT